MLLSLIGYVCLAIAGVLLVLDLYRYRKTVGKVLGWERSDTDEGDQVAYAPRIRYRTSLGITREFRSVVFGWRRPVPSVGSPIPVRYHPTAPWLHGVDRWWARLLPILFFAGCGAALVVAVRYL